VHELGVEEDEEGGQRRMRKKGGGVSRAKRRVKSGNCKMVAAGWDN